MSDQTNDGLSKFDLDLEAEAVMALEKDTGNAARYGES
jgi:hypothetical protein